MPITRQAARTLPSSSARASVRSRMRAFHLSWFAFFLAFFGWFGIAPLMAIVREDLDLTQAQVGNTIIASVAITAPGWWRAAVCVGIAASWTQVGLVILIAVGVAKFVWPRR